MRAYLIPFLFPMLIEVGSAQMINSSTVMSVSPTTTIGIETDFLNTGTLINQGDLFLTGDWMNVGVYDSAGGQLIFSSSERQEIINNGQNIDNLVIQNGEKVLSDDLTVTGELSLNDGVLIVNEEVKLTLGQGVRITGAGTDAYIDGRLYQTGTGDLFYPIGSADEYLPVTLKDVTGNAPEIGLKAYAETPLQSPGETLTELVGTAYWQLFSDENYGSGLIQLPYPNVTTSEAVVIAQASSETNNFNTIGNSGVTEENGLRSITSEANAVGPFFTVATSPESAPLPPLKIVNALTPFQDGKHDYLRIENIELYPDNKVEIFDRHGNRVFSMSNYNNRDRVFIGEPNTGISGRLPDGNYFYTIKTGRTNVTSGFLFLKR